MDSNSTVKLRAAPYGGWTSPITADLIVAASIGLDSCAWDGEALVWLEERPAEEGRCVLVRREPDGRIHDLTPKGFSVRSRANEYGGGAFLVDGGRAFFSNRTDQRVWRQEGDGAPVAITPAEEIRFADFDLDRSRRRLYALREDHRHKGPPENTLVAIPVDGSSEGAVLVRGADFYAAPRVSPDGKRLAYLSWNQPDMPWDSTTLWVADIRLDGSLGEPRRVAGGPGESVLQPCWSPENQLYFVSDRSDGWWNLHRETAHRVVEVVLAHPGEFCKPPWRLGQATYGFVSYGTIACSFTQSGRWKLACIDLSSRILSPVSVPFDDVREVRVHGSRVLFLGGSPVSPRSLATVDLESKKVEVIRVSSALGIDSTFVSAPEAIDFPTAGDRSAHALFYPPKNPHFIGPAGSRPPLIVMSHGGPTSATFATFDAELQFFTSRGFAVVDVNYGGSTGYGRAYRERLNGQWGVVDVDDCIAAAKYLVARGEADGNKLCIRGASAGGYTTLCALAFREGFAAGASYYGVSDLVALATDTHKFEARYLDRLVGPYPERADLYRERSPLEHAGRMKTPVIFLQGEEDKVVPPGQSSKMAAALRAKGIPVALLTFPGEGHGFDRADSIKRAIEAELYFYARILRFTAAGNVPTVPIDNL